MTLINANSQGCLSEDTSKTYHNVTNYKTISPHPQHLPETECLSSETLLLQESDQTSKTFLIDETISNQVDLSEKFDENLSSETLCLDEHRTEATNDNFSTTEDDSETLRDTSKSKRSDSKLFRQIKERYERNTTSQTVDTPGVKRSRRTNEQHSSNIQRYPDVVLQSLTPFNISEKLPTLHDNVGNDLEPPRPVELIKEDDTTEKLTVDEEKEEKLASAPYYKDLRKSKLKKDLEKGTDVKNVEFIKSYENDEKKLHNYENINNTEEYKSEDLSNIIVASPRKRKQKTSENSTPKEKCETVKVKDPDGVGDQHIYEEIVPCSTEKEEKGEDCKAEVHTDHIYDELQQTKRSNKLLLGLRSSVFRLWAALTPWALARRVFWRGEKTRQEEKFTELTRHSSRGRLNKNKRNVTINN